MKKIFEETQRASNWVIVIPVVLVILLMWYGFIQQIYFNIPFGTDPASDGTLIFLWIVFGIGFPIFFLYIKLETIIYEDRLSVKFRPFHMKERIFLYSEIKSIEVETYRPLKEFLGYGLRISSDGTVAYNMKGNKGIRIEMNNGKKVLIGTQRAEEVEKALKIHIH